MDVKGPAEIHDEQIGGHGHFMAIVEGELEMLAGSGVVVVDREIRLHRASATLRVSWQLGDAQPEFVLPAIFREGTDDHSFASRKEIGEFYPTPKDMELAEVVIRFFGQFGYQPMTRRICVVKSKEIEFLDLIKPLGPYFVVLALRKREILVAEFESQ